VHEGFLTVTARHGRMTSHERRARHQMFVLKSCINVKVKDTGICNAGASDQVSALTTIAI